MSLVPVLSHMNPVHTFTPYFPKIHSNINFLSMPLCYKCYLPFIFSYKNFVYALLLSHASYKPTDLILHDLVTLLISGEAYKLRSSSLCGLLQSLSTTSLLGLHILQNTCNLCSALVSEVKFHTHTEEEVKLF